MTWPLPTDVKTGQHGGEVPLADVLNTVGQILNDISGTVGAVLITKTTNGRGWKLAVVPDGTTLQIVANKLAIKDGGVTAAKLASGAVTAGKIAADAVTATEIAAGAVGTSELANDAVGTAQIATGAVTGSKIATNTISTTQMGLYHSGAQAFMIDPVTFGTLNITNGIITSIT